MKIESKAIPGFPGYFASWDGEIFTHRLAEPKRLAARMHKGYLNVFVRNGIGRCSKKKIPVHRLVLMAWTGLPSDGDVSRHLDGNPLNNRIENLAWGTPSQNVHDSILHGTASCLRRGEHHPRSKLKDLEVSRIRSALVLGIKQAEIAVRYGISQKHVSDIGLFRTRVPSTPP